MYLIRHSAPGFKRESNETFDIKQPFIVIEITIPCNAMM